MQALVLAGFYFLANQTFASVINYQLKDEEGKVVLSALESELTPAMLQMADEDTVTSLNAAEKTKLKNLQEVDPIDVESSRKLHSIVPRGSAVITTAGRRMKSEGITHVIHAATGTFGRAPCTPESIRSALSNTVLLAKEHNIKRIAVPFLCGQIFLDHVAPLLEVNDESSDDPQTNLRVALAKHIIKVMIEVEDDREFVMVIYNRDTNAITAFDLAKKELTAAGVAVEGIEFVYGNIVSFADHESPAIVNAANMELVLGAGVAGAIANAAGKGGQEINEHAEEIKTAFLADYKNILLGLDQRAIKSILDRWEKKLESFAWAKSAPLHLLLDDLEKDYKELAEMLDKAYKGFYIKLGVAVTGSALMLYGQHKLKTSSKITRLRQVLHSRLTSVLLGVAPAGIVTFLSVDQIRRLRSAVKDELAFVSKKKKQLLDEFELDEDFVANEQKMREQIRRAEKFVLGYQQQLRAFTDNYSLIEI